MFVCSDDFSVSGSKWIKKIIQHDPLCSNKNLSLMIDIVVFSYISSLLPN